MSAFYRVMQKILHFKVIIHNRHNRFDTKRGIRTLVLLAQLMDKVLSFSMYFTTRIFYLRPITGHGFTPDAGSEGRIIGTRLTTENASLRRTARLMN